MGQPRAQADDRRLAGGRAAGDWPRPTVSEDNLRRTLGDTGWVITELESVIVPIADGESAVMWSLQARRSVSL